MKIYLLNHFYNILKTRYTTYYKQEWLSTLHDMSQMSVYCTLKKVFEPEKYIQSLNIRNIFLCFQNFVLKS